MTDVAREMDRLERAVNAVTVEVDRLRADNTELEGALQGSHDVVDCVVAENNRLRAAIAPTPENVEMAANALWEAGDRTHFPDFHAFARTILTAIAARAKLTTSTEPSPSGMSTGPAVVPRPVSPEYLEALRDAGASASLVTALADEQGILISPDPALGFPVDFAAAVTATLTAPIATANATITRSLAMLVIGPGGKELLTVPMGVTAAELREHGFYDVADRMDGQDAEIRARSTP